MSISGTKKGSGVYGIIRDRLVACSNLSYCYFVFDNVLPILLINIYILDKRLLNQIFALFRFLKNNWNEAVKKISKWFSISKEEKVPKFSAEPTSSIGSHSKLALGLVKCQPLSHCRFNRLVFDEFGIGQWNFDAVDALSTN